MTGILLHVSARLSENQDKLHGLDRMERNKRLAVRQLGEKEARLRSSANDLAVKVKVLTGDEQAKIYSIASVKEQHQSTNKKLMERELSLRQTIDILEVCQERLKAEIEAAREERDLLSRAPLVDE